MLSPRCMEIILTWFKPITSAVAFASEVPRSSAFAIRFCCNFRAAALSAIDCYPC